MTIGVPDLLGMSTYDFGFTVGPPQDTVCPTDVFEVDYESTYPTSCHESQLWNPATSTFLEEEQVFPAQMTYNITNMYPVAPSPYSDHSSPITSTTSPYTPPSLIQSGSASEEEADSDEEYVPVARTSRRRRQAPSPYYISADSPSPCHTPLLKRARIPRLVEESRNVQATGQELERLQKAMDNNTIDKFNFVCPLTHRRTGEKVCTYKGNRRLPDFRRHLQTHLPRSKNFVCKGVAFETYTGPTGRDCTPCTVPGHPGLWIGGCGKTFTRRDALKRHLKLKDGEGGCLR